MPDPHQITIISGQQALLSYNKGAFQTIKRRQQTPVMMLRPHIPVWFSQISKGTDILNRMFFAKLPPDSEKIPGIIPVQFIIKKGLYRICNIWFVFSPYIRRNIRSNCIQIRPGYFIFILQSHISKLLDRYTQHFLGFIRNNAAGVRNRSCQYQHQNHRHQQTNTCLFQILTTHKDHKRSHQTHTINTLFTEKRHQHRQYHIYNNLFPANKKCSHILHHIHRIQKKKHEKCTKDHVLGGHNDKQLYQWMK